MTSLVGKSSLIGKILDCDSRCWRFESLLLPLRIRLFLLKFYKSQSSTDYSLLSVPFVNFFKEAFLFDYNYKVLFNTTMFNYFIVGALIFNFNFVNLLQLNSLYKFSKYKTLTLNKSLNLRSLLFLLGKSLALVLLLVLLVH